MHGQKTRVIILKILFIAPLPPPVTGQSVAVEALFAQLVADGFTVTSVNTTKRSFRQGINSWTRIMEIWLMLWKTWRAGKEFDAVYITTSESFAGNLKDILLLIVLGELRSKTWLHLHGGAGMRNLLANRKSYIGRLNAFFLKRVAGLIVLGERLVSIYDDYVPLNRIKIVKNFASDSLFQPEQRIAEKWMNTSIIKVLFLSNLLPGKGYEDLLKAISSLPPERLQQFKFDFAGGFESTHDEARFREMIKDLPQVQYHGIVHGKQKIILLEEAHVFCLPTYYPYEGQPISILEAYASGCVVLATDHSGIFDIFVPGKNGWKVEARCPASINAALEAVATSLIFAREIAFRNRKEANLMYTKHVHLRSLYAALGLEPKN